MARSPEQIRHDLLVLRAQSGDRGALDQLVRLWERRLWYVALARSNDHDAAWDIAQEAWLAILRGLRSLREPEAFGRWATQIVFRAAAGRIRRSQRHGRMIDKLASMSPDSSTPAESVVNAQSLSTLPTAQRTVMVLHYFEQIKIAEISEMLGVPPGTVKSRLYHARENLRKLLGDEK